MKMPFGRHRGADLDDLSDNYLTWLYGCDLREPLKSAVARAWRQRFDPPPPTFTSETQRMALAIVAAGYREVAFAHHPDRGGDTTLMQAVNAAKDFLRRAIRREVVAVVTPREGR